MDLKWIGLGVLGIAVVFVLFVIILFIGAYNGMVTLDQKVNSSWSEVENQYQRQADLIPNLASITASAVKTETNFVIAVTEARTKWLNAKTLNEKDQAGVEMNQSLANFVSAIATNEAYPVLQANKQYVAIMDEVAGTQNRIATARGRFIEAIQAYNTSIKQIPNNFLAGMFGFTAKEYYSAQSGAMETPVLGEGTLP